MKKNVTGEFKLKTNLLKSISNKREVKNLKKYIKDISTFRKLIFIQNINSNFIIKKKLFSQRSK